jgi:hypothetical protein
LVEITAWVWICGSSSREVDWRNVAMVSPPVSTNARLPLRRIRVVEPWASR